MSYLFFRAEVLNKKIANISFKQPYDILSKIEDKSDFSSVRGVVDVVRTEILKNLNVFLNF